MAVIERGDEHAAKEVLLKALDRVENESEMKMALQHGAGIMEAYREYVVL